MNDAEHLYRIHAVEELTGVSAATLRAWERRYGFPSPSRTASAYRLYDQRDVTRILQMRELIDSGVAAAEAARQVLARADGPSAPAQPAAAHPHPDAFTVAADRIVDAASTLDSHALDQSVQFALSLGSSLDVFELAFAPALRRIGDLWEQGRLTVAHEHLAAQRVQAAALELLRLSQPSVGAPQALLACFEDEDHVIGLLGVGLRLAAWGYRAILLGARTPPQAVARVVEQGSPAVVALSIMIAPPMPRGRSLVDAYADACAGVPWAVGGPAAEGLRPFVEGRGGLVLDSPERLRQLLGRPAALEAARARRRR
jgi:DNA-binding transcriptional MerR regulator